MGQQPAHQFAPPKAIGQTPNNGIVTQSVAPPMLPQNALQPLIQNQIPFTQTANNVPTAGAGGGDFYGGNRYGPSRGWMDGRMSIFGDEDAAGEYGFAGARLPQRRYEIW